jgi:hypothetical protein
MGSIVNLGEGMSYNVTRPLAIVRIHELHVETIVLGGGLGLIFVNTTI